MDYDKSMLRKFVYTLGFMFLVSTLLHADGTLHVFDLSAVRITGNDTLFYPYDKVDRLLGTLGMPDSEEAAPTGSEGVSLIVSHWPGIILKYAKSTDPHLSGQISYLEITDRKFQLQSGITMGSTRREVLEIFGEPRFESEADKTLIYIIEEPFGTRVLWNLVFEFRNDKVIRIYFNRLNNQMPE
jgi:hypothetical protein